RKGSAPSAPSAALMLRPERFADHGVLVFCDIGTAGIEEIEQTSDIRVGTRGSQVLRDKLADVLGKRNAHITGFSLRLALDFRFQRDLRSRHHHGTIVPPWRCYLDCVSADCA